MLRVRLSVVLLLVALQDSTLNLLGRAQAFNVQGLYQKRFGDRHKRQVSVDDCMAYLEYETHATTEGLSCNGTWDTVLCWPPTPAGEVVYQPCPPLRGLDPTKMATKKCGPDGRWEGRVPGDHSRPQGWTDYSACYSDMLRDLFRRLTAHENQVD